MNENNNENNNINIKNDIINPNTEYISCIKYKFNL